MNRLQILPSLPGTMQRVALCLVFFSVGHGLFAQFVLPYNLKSPQVIHRLSAPELKEFSDLSPTERPDELLAIADERGEAFFLDTTGKILRRVLFRDKGDFEGIEMVGQCIYALKSDGDIFEIGCWDQAKSTVNTYETVLTKKDDTEGLCFDPDRKALLVACKGDPKSDTLRGIFAFDLKKKTLNPKPVYTIDPKEVNRLAPWQADEKQDFFSPSAIAIRPLTNDVYVISTALKRLIVLDYRTGAIKYADYLDKQILPQPEALSFDRNGNLYIGSEGKGGDGLLLRFDIIDTTKN
ncbi:MAG: SdiA-regulated domain-containing protein [Saprospiraceae bacterium]